VIERALDQRLEFVARKAKRDEVALGPQVGRPRELAVGFARATEAIQAEAAVVVQARALVRIAQASGCEPVVERDQGVGKAPELEERRSPLAPRPEAPRRARQDPVQEPERALGIVVLGREHRLPLHQVDRVGKARATARDLAPERGRVGSLIELLDAIEEPLERVLVARRHVATPSAYRTRAVISTGVNGMRGPGGPDRSSVVRTSRNAGPSAARKRGPITRSSSLVSTRSADR
jgi:hypothetical protein